MKFNDVELELNLFDADVLQRFYDCGAELDKAIIASAKLPENRVYEAMKMQCDGICAFLDGVFGEGCSKEILKNPNNLKECFEVYKAILKEEERQSEELLHLFGEITAIRKNGVDAEEPSKAVDAKVAQEEVQEILKDVVDPLAPSVRLFKPAG